MLSKRLTITLLFITIGLLTAVYLWGISHVPFHPDESTYIYMSADMDRWLHNPFSLAWQPGDPVTPEVHYRLIDAPLTRYLLGLARLATGTPPLAADWDWGRSWQENQQIGAMPSADLLFISRLASAVWFPLTLLFIFYTTRAAGGNFAGLMAVLFLGTNALIWLHTRRAMGEGILLLGMTAVLGSLVRADRRPWLAGLALAMAVNAKQSALFLLPAVFLAVIWMPKSPAKRWQHIGLNLAQLIVVFGLACFLLNPIFWKAPLPTLRKTLSERQMLVQKQLADRDTALPGQILDSPGNRLAVLAGNVYVAPLMFAELGNYQLETHQAESDYLQSPYNTLWQNSLAGGIFLFLTLLGFAWGINQLRKTDHEHQRLIGLIFLATFGLLLGLVWTIPLGWQRYALPLLPLACFWAAYGLPAKIIPPTWRPHVEGIAPVINFQE